MTKSKFRRLFIVAFGIASALLIANGFVHNTLLWGIAGMGIGIEIGVLASYIFAGED